MSPSAVEVRRKAIREPETMGHLDRIKHMIQGLSLWRPNKWFRNVSRRSWVVRKSIVRKWCGSEMKWFREMPWFTSPPFCPRAGRRLPPLMGQGRSKSTGRRKARKESST